MKNLISSLPNKNTSTWNPTTSSLKERRKSWENSSKNLTRRTSTVANRTRKSWISRRLFRASETTKWGWKKRRMSNKRKLRTFKVAPVMLNKKEISFKSRSWRQRDKTNSLNLPSEGSRLKCSWPLLKIQKCKMIMSLMARLSWLRANNNTKWNQAELTKRMSKTKGRKIHMALAPFKVARNLHKHRPVSSGQCSLSWPQISLL